MIRRFLKKLGKFITNLKNAFSEKGLLYIIHYVKNKLILSIKLKNQKFLIRMKYWYYQKFLFRMKYWYYQKFKSSKCFIFQGKTYEYFYHKHNNTWANERAVEIPIIWEILKENEGKSILEVGNVLSAYFSVNHDIVDKYEKGNIVINQDVVLFKPVKKYDLIVSISTLEHVGWDEIPQEPFKILKAIENLKNLLVQGGKIVITLPKGHSPVLDKLLTKNRLNFSKKYYMKRKSKSNRWEEVKWSHISNLRYDSPFNFANGLIIGIIEK